MAQGHPGHGPATSVVVVTWNRAEVLREALAALAALDPAPAEVVVVDDGSTDHTLDVIAQSGFRAVSIAHAGIAAARNAGWRATTGEVVAMTDDDCVVTPGWLGALVAPIVDGHADLVQGRTLPREDQADNAGPWSRTLRVESEAGYYQTANIAYRRTMLEAVGGFDEALARVGEDTDLAWRIRKAGGRTAFVPEALAHHAVWRRTFAEHLRSRPKWADVSLVLKRHPELRAKAHHKVFYHRGHERVLLEVGGVAAALVLHPLGGLVAALATLALRAKAARRWGRGPIDAVAIGAGNLVVDAVEVGAFLRAAVRWRVVVA